MYTTVVYSNTGPSIVWTPPLEQTVLFQSPSFPLPFSSFSLTHPPSHPPSLPPSFPPYINSCLQGKSPDWVDMVIQYDDPYHHPQTEQLSLLTLESSIVLTAGREGGEREGRGGRHFHSLEFHTQYFSGGGGGGGDR